MKYIKTFESKQLNHQLLNALKTKASLDRIRKLIANGADVNCKSVSERTPLILAINKIWFNCAKLLIENGADVNYKGRNNETALMNIPYFGEYSINKYLENIKKIINLLIESGTDLNVINNKNEDVFDLFDKTPFDFRTYIINNYPEKYDNYLVKKSGNKYNL